MIDVVAGVIAAVAWLAHERTAGASDRELLMHEFERLHVG